MLTYLFKIIIIGNSGVGKSNLLTRYTENDFSLETKSTIGLEFKTKEFNVTDSTGSNIILKAQLWDTAGQERYKAITQAYYRGAVGVIIVYDVANKASFEAVPQLLDQARNLINPSAEIILVGNKTDLKWLRAVSYQSGENFARDNGLLFVEASALDSSNVSHAFEFLLNNIYVSFQKNKIIESFNVKKQSDGLKKVPASVVLVTPELIENTPTCCSN
jgi:small GTP-binding protein